MFIFKRALIFSLAALVFSSIYPLEKVKVIYLQKLDSGSDFSEGGFYRRGNLYGEGGQLTISFDKPVFKLSDIDAMKSEIQKKIKLKITPEIKGEFRPIGTQQAAFVFRQKLKPSTRYVVEINVEEIKSIDGGNVTVLINHIKLENGQFEFMTEKLRVLNLRTGENLDDPIFVFFSWPVDPNNLKKELKITEGSVLNIEYSIFSVINTNYIESNGLTYGYIYKNPRAFEILTAKRKPGSQYSISISQDLHPIDGELGMDREYEYSFNTYSPLKYIDISTGEYDFINQSKTFHQDSEIYFRFNNELDQRVNLKNSITVDPPVKHLNYQYSGKSIIVTADFTGGQNYHIKIIPQVKDKYGQLINGPVEADIPIEHSYSILGIPTGYMVMENYIPMILPLKIRNIDKVDFYYTICRTKEDIVNYISRPPSEDEFMKSAKLKQIKVKETWDVFFNYRLDLARLIPVKPPFMVYMAEADKKVSENNQDRIKRAGIILFTDMGLTVKSGPYQTLVYLRSLKSNQPVSGANVYEILFDKQNNPDIKLKGRTDSKGVCTFQGEFPMPFIMVEKDNKYCINYGNNKYSNDYEYYDNSDYGMDYNSLFYNKISQKSIINSGDYRSYNMQNAMIFTDRFLYKPGETINVKGIIRYRWEDRWNTTEQEGSSQPIEFKVYNSRDEEITNTAVQPDAWGSFHFKINLKDSDPTGYYRISSTNYIECSFSVQDFKPAKAEMRIIPKKTEYAWGDNFEADLIPWYLFGAPVIKPVVYDVSVQPIEFISSKYPDYQFSRPAEDQGQERRDYSFTLMSGTDLPDSSGKLSITKLIKNDIFFGDAGIIISANTELDDKSRIYGNRADITVFNPVHVGIRVNPYFVNANKEFKIDLIAVDNNDNPVKNQDVKMEIDKVDWKSYQKVGVNGRLEWYSENTKTRVKSADLQIGKEEYPLTINEPGFYEVKVTSKIRSHDMVSHGSFYVLGPGWVGWSMDNSYTISLDSDKKAYRVGDTAYVLVKNPFKSAHALITMEREKIYEIRQEEITDSMAMIPIRITKENIPNIYVSVMLFSGRTGTNQVKNDTDLAKPSYRIGYIDLPVYTAEKSLNIKIIPDRDNFKPGENAGISFEVKDYKGNLVPEAELTISVADKGVLNLVNYKLPNPLDNFYGPRRLSVFTSEMREWIYGQRYLAEKGEVVGGDGFKDENLGMGMIVPRMNFKYTAFYTNKIVVTGGKTNIDFTLPDNLTTWKIMVVSQTKDSSFGYGESQFSVKRPLMILSTLPRMVRNLDYIEAGVMIFNYTEKGGYVTVAISCDQPMKFLFPLLTNVYIDKNKSKEVKFAFNVPAIQAEEAKFTISGKVNGASDGVKETVWIRNPMILETTALYEKTTNKADEKISITSNVIPELSRVEFNLSQTAFNELSGCLDYLVEYPYGCLEQKSSSILPLILGEDVILKYDLLKNKTGRDLRQVVQTILEEMPKYLGDDGFKYWTDSINSTNPYLTVYAGFVLCMARYHKYSIPEDFYNRVRDLVKDYADGSGKYESWFEISPYYRALVKNYALFVASMNGYENVGSIKNAYAELKDKLKDNLSAQAYLLIAVSKYKNFDGKDIIIKDISDRLLASAQLDTSTCYFAGFENWDWFYYNRTISTAIVLQALLEAGINFKDSHKVIRWLTLARKQGRWATTHENAMVFWAYNTYLGQFEKEEPNFEATGDINKKEVIKTLFASRNTPVYTTNYSLTDEKSPELDIELRKNGTGILYYNIRYQYAPVNPVYKREMGFSLEKQVLDYETGKEITDNNYIRGRRYIIKLNVFSEKTRNFVVLDDQLPAGFEPVNLEFATEQAETEGTKSAVEGNDRGNMWWWGIFNHREQYRDRVIFTADYLMAGKHELSYVVRAATTGKFSQPQLKVEEMYDPETFGSLSQPGITVKEE